MNKVHFKNVIGDEKTASKVSKDMLGVLVKDGLPIGQHIPSNWTPPEGYSLKKLKVNNVPIECTSLEGVETGKVILNLHGGGYILGLLDMMRNESIEYVKASNGAMLIQVDYRIAPNDHHPAALEDAITVYKWLLEQGYKSEDIVVSGASAGGGLAAALVLYLRDQGLPLPKGVYLISPWGDLTTEAVSREANYEIDPILGKYGSILKEELIKSSYLGDNDIKNPYISPVFGDYQGFPKTLIQVGTYEVLYDDSVNIYDKIEAAGGDVKLSSYYGMIHCFVNLLMNLPETQAAWAEAQEFFEECFGC